MGVVVAAADEADDAAAEQTVRECIFPEKGAAKNAATDAESAKVARCDCCCVVEEYRRTERKVSGRSDTMVFNKSLGSCS